MKHKFSVIIPWLFVAHQVCFAQQGIDYRERPDPHAAGAMAWKNVPANVQVSFGSIDLRYAKTVPPSIAKPGALWHDTAWKGERVHTQLLVWTKKSIIKLRVTATALQDGRGHQIPASAVTAGFIRYVLTDSLNKEGHGCGISPTFDSSLVADGIDLIPQKRWPLSPHNPCGSAYRFHEMRPLAIIKGCYTCMSMTAHLPFHTISS